MLFAVRSEAGFRHFEPPGQKAALNRAFTVTLLPTASKPQIALGRVKDTF